MNDKMLDRLDLNLLRAFASIYRHGSITDAAADCGVSQPAMSNALSRLRRFADDPLFVRRKNVMVPTPLAESLSAHVLRGLQSIEDGLAGLQQFDPTVTEREFSVGMRASFEFPLLRYLTGRVQAAAPQATIVSSAIDRRTLDRDLSTGKLDVCVDVPRRVSADIRFHRLLGVDMCIAVSQTVCNPAAELSTDDWLALDHVVVSGRSRGPSVEDTWLHQAGLSRRVALRCQHYHTACQVVAESRMALVLPRFYADHFRSLLPLTIIEPPVQIPTLELNLYWHSYYDGDPGSTWFRELILDVNQLEK